MFLTHLRRNVVAYLALVVALGTGTAYAAGSIPNGSVTAAKLHTNAVTSTKIKNGTIKNEGHQEADLRAEHHPRQLGTPPAVPDVVSVAPYDFTLPTKGRTSVTVFIPTIGGRLRQRQPDQPTIGLYIDNVPIPGPRPTCPCRPTTGRSSSPPRSSSAARRTPAGSASPAAARAVPTNLSFPGAKSWTIIQTG